MRINIQNIVLIFYIATSEAKKELPLCPSNMQFFPQNLPMHCRMPVKISPNSLETIPLPAPGLPGPIPGAIPGSIPGTLPGPMPMPMPMAPMPQSPSHKLPVIVMPLYSPDKPNVDQMNIPYRPRRRKHRSGLKRRRSHFYTSDEDSIGTDTSLYDSSEKSSEHGWWRRSREGKKSNRQKLKRKRHEKKDLLTPVLQYVTKDGYVIFEKQISKGEAKKWLVNEDDNKTKIAPSKGRDNSNSKELKDDIEETKFLSKDDENIEVKTEKSSHYKKKTKRKLPPKKTSE